MLQDAPTGSAGNLGPPKRLQKTLADFRGCVNGVRGIAVADKSGLPVIPSFATKANVLTVTAMATMAIQSSPRIYRSRGLAGPNEVVMVGPESTVSVPTVSQAQPSVIVMLEGFTNLGLVRIEVERLGRERSEILGI